MLNQVAESILTAAKNETVPYFELAGAIHVTWTDPWPVVKVGTVAPDTR